MAFDSENLIILKLLTNFGQAGSHKYVHFLGQKPGRDIKLGEFLDFRRRYPDLLFQLTHRPDLRILARIQRSRTDLEQMLSCCVPILPDKRNGPIIENGNYDRAALVHDDLAFVFKIALADRVDTDIEDLSFVNGVGRNG